MGLPAGAMLRPAKPATQLAQAAKPVPVTLVALKKPLKGHHRDALHRSGGLVLPAEQPPPAGALYSDAEDDEYPVVAARPCAHDGWRTTGPAGQRQDWAGVPVEAEQWVRSPAGGQPEGLPEHHHQQQQQWAPAYSWPWPGSASSTPADAWGPWGALQWPRVQQVWRLLAAAPPHY